MSEEIDISVLERALTADRGLQCSGHYTQLYAFRRRLYHARKRNRERYASLRFSLRSDRLIITNGKGLDAALEEIFS